MSGPPPARAPGGVQRRPPCKSVIRARQWQCRRPPIAVPPAPSSASSAFPAALEAWKGRRAPGDRYERLGSRLARGAHPRQRPLRVEADVYAAAVLLRGQAPRRRANNNNGHDHNQGRSGSPPLGDYAVRYRCPGSRPDQVALARLDGVAGLCGATAGAYRLPAVYAIPLGSGGLSVDRHFEPVPAETGTVQRRR